MSNGNILRKHLCKDGVRLTDEGTKLDETFPSSQLRMDGFSLSYRLDRNRNGEGVMIFARKDIPSKFLTKHNFPSDVEVLFVELNFRKSKWLLCGTYHPPTQNHQYFF